VFRARVLARTLVYVFLVTSTFFAGFFRITYLYPTEDYCTVHYTYSYLNIAEAVRRSVSTQPEFSFTTELIGASETSGETLHIQGKVF